MCTTTRRLILCAGFAAVLGIAGGCAELQQKSNVVGYRGAPLNFGTTPSAEELAKFYAYPPDGRGLPAGSGTYAQGRKVYVESCQSCHGDKMQGVGALGGRDPFLGGRGTLATKKPLQTVESFYPYATTVFDYIKRSMPYHAPGSLTDGDVYAVTAYILGEASIIGKSDVLNAQTLPRVQMPNRDGFIPDARPDVR